MNDNKYERAAPGLPVVGLNLVNIFFQIATKREPDRGRKLVQDCEEAGVIRGLGDVKNPANESDSDRYRHPLGDVEPRADFMNFFSQEVRGIKTCRSGRSTGGKIDIGLLPAPMHPKPPAADTSAANAGVQANAMGAHTIGVVISAHTNQHLAWSRICMSGSLRDLVSGVRSGIIVGCDKGLWGVITNEGLFKQKKLIKPVPTGVSK